MLCRCEYSRQLGPSPAAGQQLVPMILHVLSSCGSPNADLSHFYYLCCTLQTSTGLKGTRKLQFGGISLASSQGISNSLAALNTGGGTQPNAGTGNSFGTGNAVGTGNGFIYSPQGQALSSGTSGGNSTANTALTVLGNSTTTGLLTSAGIGQGSAGGNAIFGPSLAAAIAAATPAAAVPAPEVEEVVEENSKGGGGNNNNNNNAAAPAAPVAPTAPAFSFQVGLPTGGGGGGFGLGSGVTNGNIATNGVNATGADEAYGSALANGFGFGQGSGVAVNVANEQAGGQGGGTSLGQGQFTFELDDVTTGAFANNGVTKSQGGGGAYVGFDPPTPVIFGAISTPAPAATP
jgi:hypothetical protein